MMLVLIHKILFCHSTSYASPAKHSVLAGTLEERQRQDGEWRLDKNTFLCLHLISKNIIDVR